ncbi:hypothetical protein RJZ56_001990 [Blastomyces dermatitidis]|uniref:Uncharacterized protein n=2 Tax=Ajellomyces dermatitidis TaxID=5039 RepID=F2TC16_AJEDA|nr:uncharacterized protein BDCG_05526 [Blastomyces dermatitidis ER-3]EEQ90406.2 hypothetical protein BDCG_05526 [Blastomyces dermatitidis ER-3]EGE80779.2 hypothetical protein BDDG_03720 [Blastomyces dermatitidis ATCC 18188]EQL30438.1 hypothetical protein BDFG_07031 [Blastomyces dermatitidis ATCC 26199]
MSVTRDFGEKEASWIENGGPTEELRCIYMSSGGNTVIFERPTPPLSPNRCRYETGILAMVAHDEL